jgi:2-iminobutanoate/2-iminopropanoate deaminase
MGRPLFVLVFAALATGAATSPIAAQGATPPAAPPAAAPPTAGPADANSPQYVGSRGSLSAAVRVGNMIYLSGQLGTDTTRGILPETARALGKIRALLEANNSAMDRVVRCTVFLADIAEWAQMNTVYNNFFPTTNRPARSALAVSGMVQNARVEIECMATVKPGA